MNARIRRNGGKIYLASDIHLSYYCRDSLKGISDMAVKNGMWNIITMKLCPGSMGIRHFVPLAFLLSLLVLIPLAFVHPLFAWALGAELVLYFGLDLLFTAKAAQEVRYVPAIFILFPIFHLAYGFGSLKGICKILGGKYK